MPSQTRIRFARDTDPATVKAEISCGATRKFLLFSADGQIVTINVFASNGPVKIGATEVKGLIDGAACDYFG